MLGQSLHMNLTLSYAHHTTHTPFPRPCSVRSSSKQNPTSVRNLVYQTPKNLRHRKKSTRNYDHQGHLISSALWSIDDWWSRHIFFSSCGYKYFIYTKI